MCAHRYPEIFHFCPGTPIILVGTKVDQRNDFATLMNLQKSGRQPVTHAQGMELAKRIKAINYIECSAKTGENLKSVFDEAVRSVLIPPKKSRKVGACSLL